MAGGGVRVAGMPTTPSITMGAGVMAVGMKEVKEGGQVKSEKKKDGNEWTDRAVDLLLELYEQKWRGVSFGNLRVKDWEHVASTMDERYHWQGERKTFLQCKNKIENLKKRYKLEREKKNENGEIMSDWPWFSRLHEIIGKAPKQVGLIEDSENGTLALGLGSTVEGPDAEKEYEGEGQGGGLPQLGQIVPIAMRDDSKMRALTESQISSERGSFMETPPKDRKHGSTAACGTHCMQNVPEVSGKCGRKRRRNAARSPIKDLAASFSNFFNAMAKVEVERMQMLRELIASNTRKRPRITPTSLDNDQCRWCSAHGTTTTPGRDTIHQKLMEALSPTNLEVEDVSAEQSPGLQLGAARTNFNVRIVSPLFEGQSLVQRHRMIYNILQDELKSGVHALSIVARTPTETAAH
ncbi:hypothetical protein R1sor_001630 [Riccia sorocarpa]|uniref:Myb/SANT-like DNA-binding domain-containing protein n=1 Tax=Riccia sorocarpa TaxID=122646 RepID=A0ABD3GWU1_9MARC